MNLLKRILRIEFHENGKNTILAPACYSAGDL